MTDLVGQSLGRYHILEQLGEGGMATVYKAYDTRLEREVAVKIIRRQAFPEEHLERILVRFEREAKALARMSHPNIIKVHDYGEHESAPYLVLEYFPGGTLKERLGGGTFDWQEAVRLLNPIAGALAYAHRQGMVHRDVKPSNILISAEGDPMLTDFGIAKILDEGLTRDLTGTGMGVGTPEYMAPEQFQGGASESVDIYALGVVLYEMVTGRKPYTAETPAALIIKQASDPLPRPSNFTTNLPEALERVLLKALAKKPEARYQSMAEMGAALANLAGDPRGRGMPKKTRKDVGPKTRLQESPGATVLREKEQPARSRRPWWVWVGGFGVLALVGSLGWMAGGGRATLPDSILKATSTPQPAITRVLDIGSSLTREEDGMVMLYVPKGEFRMGSDKGSNDEQPVHRVYLDGYWIDRTEVSNGMYAACVQAGACEQYAGGDYGDPAYMNHPVVNVSWFDAETYCAWTGARLPTEAEWEKAARGTDGRSYPWGEDIDCSKAQYYGCVGDASQVASYNGGISSYGVYDMAGNVWEWVADWYDSEYYHNLPYGDPPGPASGVNRVLRGGSWASYFSSLRSPSRNSQDPWGSNDDVGFRCGMDATP